MRICIIGCGAIGGIFAAFLAQLDHVEVWAYDPDRNTVDDINAKGLRVNGAAELTAHIQATVNPQKIPACDFGIIATKTYQTRAAIEATAHLFQRGCVCSFQNGVGNEAILAEYVDHVIAGTTLLGGHLSAPGVVNYDTVGKSWLGADPARPATSEQVETLAGLLSESGLEAEIAANPIGVQWTKLIFNAAANPVCAVTRLPYGEAWRLPETRKLIEGLAREGMAVANALQIVLDSNPLEQLEKASHKATAHLPSMLSDILNQKPTEIDALNGSILRHAQSLEIACPLNENIVALVRGIERSWQLNG